MPAIVGIVNVNSVGGVMNIGDVRIISPRTSEKTFAGGGSFNSGTNLGIDNSRSVINVYESAGFDQTIFREEDRDLFDKERDLK